MFSMQLHWENQAYNQQTIDIHIFDYAFAERDWRLTMSIIIHLLTSWWLLYLLRLLKTPWEGITLRITLLSIFFVTRHPVHSNSYNGRPPFGNIICPLVAHSCQLCGWRSCGSLSQQLSIQQNFRFLCGTPCWSLFW